MSANSWGISTACGGEPGVAEIEDAERHHRIALACIIPRVEASADGVESQLKLGQLPRELLSAGASPNRNSEGLRPVVFLKCRENALVSL